jgi:hypothetical protein
MFDIELTSEKKPRADRIYAVGRIPITPHAEIVAATLVVKVVVKTAELPVLKANPGETRPSGYRRGHDFHYDADTPFLITEVGHLIAYAEKESLSFSHELTSWSQHNKVN